MTTQELDNPFTRGVICRALNWLKGPEPEIIKPRGPVTCEAALISLLDDLGLDYYSFERENLDSACQRQIALVIDGERFTFEVVGNAE